MTRSEIEALFARRLEAWRRLDHVRLAGDYGDEAVIESPMSGEVVGRVAIEQYYRKWFEAFSNYTFRREALLIDGDSVVEVLAITATHVGDFLGMPPSGRKFDVHTVFLYTLKDGEILRDRRIYDLTGLLIQIGVLKAKAS